MIAALALLLAFAYVTLMVRHAFQGEYLDGFGHDRRGELDLLRRLARLRHPAPRGRHLPPLDHGARGLRPRHRRRRLQGVPVRHGGADRRAPRRLVPRPRRGADRDRQALSAAIDERADGAASDHANAHGGRPARPSSPSGGAQLLSPTSAPHTPSTSSARKTPRSRSAVAQILSPAFFADARIRSCSCARSKFQPVLSSHSNDTSQ